MRLPLWMAVVFCGHATIAQEASDAPGSPPPVGTQGTSVVAIQEITGIGQVGPVTRLASGFEFTEGPAFDGEKFLYFTDVAGNTIYRMDLQGNAETFLKPSGYANGLVITKNGKLLCCMMDGRVVAINPADQSTQILGEEFEGTRFNAPNDLVLDRAGGIYFTDPRYRAPEPWPQTVEAVYYRSPNGKIDRVASEMAAPNGVILSPDEKTLYVVPSVQKQVFAFDIGTPGKIRNRRLFCELRQPADKDNSGGDGLSIDVQGNLYVTTDLGIQVVTPSGEVLGVIKLPEQPANCGFGGRDFKTLFATCRTSVYAMEMPIAGHRFPGELVLSPPE